ncbi:MAG: hypothetical protein KC933_02325 [Myxococcales bacterium]|nr:hypothetical protein [Myxococcales bacterium]
MLGALCLLAVGTPLITVAGNKVLTDDVYRSVLALGPVVTSSTSTTAPPVLAWVPLLDTDPETSARMIQEQVQDFLLSSGYDLAHVEVEAAPAQVILRVDEGQLDKVIFLREGTLANVELRFALHLPGEIFNRPLLERKLKKLAEDTNITRAYYELVPTQPVEHRGIQVEEPTLIRGLRLLNPGSHHELRIRLERDVPRAGLSLGLGFSGSDGFYGKVGYRAGDLLFRRDRLDTEARVAFYLGDEIQSDRNPFGISHVQGKVRWSPVPLGSDAVRSYLAVDFDLFGRRRNDLAILNYYFAPLAGGLVFEAELFSSLTISLGGGYERRMFFGVDDGGEPVPILPLTPDDDTRFFVALGAEWVLNPRELRADRRHRLALRGRFLGKGESAVARPITKVFFEYEDTITFGWDELRFGVRAAHLGGAVPFYEELSIGDGFLRSGFGTQIYLRRAAAGTLEYRMSLSRDTLKVGVFNDFAVYRALDALRAPVEVRVADTFGAGLHVLLFDAFQINSYLGLTVDQALGLDLGVKAELSRAF